MTYVSFGILHSDRYSVWLGVIYVGELRLLVHAFSSYTARFEVFMAIKIQVMFFPVGWPHSAGEHEFVSENLLPT